MTVQELIDELNKIEDKSLPVYYCDNFENHEIVDGIEDYFGDVVLYNLNIKSYGT